jgi:6-phosphogluconate dehydrogenase
MKIAVVGLGRMGMQIARKLAEGGHTVIAHDHNKDAITEAASHGCTPADSREAVAQAFGDEQLVAWLMIPSEFVDDELNAWLEIAPEGSILIDGGNSDFRLTKQRSERVAAKGSQWLDIGTSGGVWGYQNGFSMMIGGDKTAFETIEPIVQVLSKPEGAYDHFGPSGSGHYVKMVHNAIEYGIMQSLAEGYRMLKEGPYDSIDLAKAGDVWEHHSVITSWLNELTRDALKENPNLDGIEGVVAESGEARWTLEVAKELGIAMPSIQASFDVRLASQQGDVNFATKIVAAQRNKFGGHAINKK